jgi:hypothetical protein
MLDRVRKGFCILTSESLSVIPAMQAGLMKKPITIEDIPNLIEIKVPKTRGKYKTKSNRIK